jgi:mono/diheme cytochrome c family protein
MRFLAGVVATLLVGAAIMGFVFGTGRFDVAATAPSDMADRLAPWVLDKALARRAREVTDPISRDAGAARRGMAHYRANCLPCHGAPGVDPEEFQEGLNPTPPGIDAPLVQNESDAVLFWVIKNGIRMTGMPAFGVNHKDAEIKDIVAFVRHVPQMTDAEQDTLKTGVGLEHHHDDEGEEGAAHGGEPAAASPSLSASAPPSASPSPHHRRRH